MKKLRWQIIIILFTGMIVGVILVTQKPQSSVNENKPQVGGTYTEAIVGSFQRLNPLLDSYNQADRDVDRLLFSGLLKFDASGNPIADLAESWGNTKDGLTYNFSIRDNVLWHDGAQFTVDDIIFTIDMIKDDNSITPSDLKSFWKEVRLNRLDDYNLQFILPEPFAPFLDYLTFGILPKHLLGDLTVQQIIESSFNLQPVGTGPYQMDRLVLGDDNKVAGVSLKMNENFYTGKPYIEKIVLRFYPDSASAFKAYQDGEVQGISEIPPSLLNNVLNEPTISAYTSRRPEMSLVLLNLNNPNVDFFQDTEVRLAMMKSVNRTLIINQILKGQAIKAESPIFPGTWAYHEEPAIEYDVDAAINQLKNAGYVFAGEGDTVRSKDGKRLSFTLTYPDDTQHKAIAESILSDWTKLGMEVKLEPMSYDEIINNKLVKRSYEAALIDINLNRSPDPDPYPFWDQGQATGGQNYSQWDNSTASEYLEQARVTFDIQERTRLYHNFQVVFRKEMPAILLYYPVYTYAVSNQVQGVQLGPLYDNSDRFSTVKDWYLIIRKGTQSEETAVP